MAGCARTLWGVADRVRVVSTLAAGWDLGAILTGLQADADARGLITWDVSVDSTITRAHQHAAGASKKGQRSKTARAASRSSRPITGWAAPAVG